VPNLVYGAAAVRTAEAGAYDEKEPTLGRTLFQPIKYTRLAKASEELAADSRFDLWGQILAPDFTQAFAAAENGTPTAGFTGGTASAGVSPAGVVSTATTGVTTASTTVITADEIISLYYALSPLYRAKGVWMMNDATMASIRSLKADTTTGEYLLQFGLDGKPAETLLGHRIVINNSMDLQTAAKDVIVFGSFEHYWICEWAGLDMQRLNELYAANGQIGFRAFKRWDAHLMLAAAFTKLTMHA